MNIQIFGIKKCFDTKKAERYFKERKIKYQFIDLTVKGISKRELESIRLSVGNINNIIDDKSKEYKKLNIEHIRSNQMREEILLNNPLLSKTPIVRNGKNATIGYEPDVWKTWE
ncbi:arsenate reductase family protein [Clostridium fallax]|uniref:Transcriptional regulator, Spx/MgsR family n=1 Tax=Clostridium fallax TaxID=1533 RepID=A0A1M4VJ85_9CLOT|nr:arsenate reductase family protein [Clostridium fallax]SHE69018.1 transcriptional regulator, Spx/MgsR family [Clostridium fallax]SQB22751.1 arsenate reductase [Clostridium fallax]